MKTFSIYGLESPEGCPRYIGATSRSLSDRLKGHVSESAHNQRKYKWFESLKPELPKIVPYCVGLSKQEAGYMEEFLIRELRKSGHDLFNVHKGGGFLVTGNRQPRIPDKIDHLSGDAREQARIQHEFQVALERERKLWLYREQRQIDQ